jgi:hypothetical protein
MFSFLVYNQKKWLYKPLRKHPTVVIEGYVFLVRAFRRFACGVLPAEEQMLLVLPGQPSCAHACEARG